MAAEWGLEALLWRSQNLQVSHSPELPLKGGQLGSKSQLQQLSLRQDRKEGEQGKARHIFFFPSLDTNHLQTNFPDPRFLFSFCLPSQPSLSPQSNVSVTCIGSSKRSPLIYKCNLKLLIEVLYDLPANPQPHLSSLLASDFMPETHKAASHCSCHPSSLPILFFHTFLPLVILISLPGTPSHFILFMANCNFLYNSAWTLPPPRSTYEPPSPSP